MRKLTAAVPANLAVFWLMLRGDPLAVLLYGFIGGFLGAILLTAIERYGSAAGIEAGREDRTGRRAPVHDFSRYSRPA